MELKRDVQNFYNNATIIIALNKILLFIHNIPAPYTIKTPSCTTGQQNIVQDEEQLLQDTKKLYRTTIFVTGKQKVVTGHKKVVQDYENRLQDGEIS